MTTVNASRQAAGLPPSPPTLSDEEFGRLIAGRSREALRLARHVAAQESGRLRLTRPLLGEVLHQSTELEELLDAYGARNNECWRPFRSTVAAAQLFADVGYVLLHIQHSTPAYRLLEVEGDFAAATEQTIAFVADVLLDISRSFVRQAGDRGIDPAAGPAVPQDFHEYLPSGRLANTLRARKDVDAGETVTYLATAFLNQAAESGVLHVPERVDPARYAECVPNSVSEEKLRQLQHQFHNLQSLYDTFVADTDAERRNTDLPVLRGHISVIFHLLETATAFSHHYERHLMGHAAEPAGQPGPGVDHKKLLDVLMNYSLVYASRYLVRARSLCQEMLRRFAKIGRTDVPGPKYRGFHVRPSTLVAKIVRHYGSEVTMELDGATFDAASPMDIFRANEKINREKRNWLVQQVANLPCLRDPACLDDPVQAVRRIVLALAEHGKVIIYERPIPVQPPDEDDADKTPMQYVLDEVKRLQATGVFDMVMEVRVTFHGDERVLNDLKLLAEHGYGEDNFGNNTPLPDELSYVRR